MLCNRKTTLKHTGLRNVTQQENECKTRDYGMLCNRKSSVKTRDYGMLRNRKTTVKHMGLWNVMQPENECVKHRITEYYVTEIRV